MARNVGWLMVVAALFLLSLSTVAQAEELQKYGVRVRAIYVMPAETFDDAEMASKVRLDDAVIPELDLEYFFTKNFSTEVILGASHHDVRLNGSVAGSTWLLPPTLTLKYHPLPKETVSPYVGAGINFTLPFSSVLSGVNDFKIENSVNWAAQAGVDVKIKDNMFFNIDYKYVAIDTRARIGGVKYDLDINPHLFGVGVGYRF